MRGWKRRSRIRGMCCISTVLGSGSKQAFQKLVRADEEAGEAWAATLDFS